jgi:4-hydroxy-tetrahydrodipicolinate reductase
VTRVGVVGATGKMGREVCRAVHAEPDLELVAAVSRSAAGQRLADVLGLDASDVVASAEIEAFIPADVEVAVDFTGPAYAPDHIAWGIDHDMHVVVGTTGFEIDPAWGAQDRVGVVVAPNFAIGAVLMMRFAEEAARVMPDAEIVELHPPTKVDAPSGTARATAARIAGARGDGRTPVRGDGHDTEVPIHSVRLPGLVAHQEVLFGAVGQTLTIRHDTTDRTAFMPGVILAIREVGSRPGLTVGLEPLLPPA